MVEGWQTTMVIFVLVISTHCSHFTLFFGSKNFTTFSSVVSNDVGRINQTITHSKKNPFFKEMLHISFENLL